MNTNGKNSKNYHIKVTRSYKLNLRIINRFIKN